MKKIIICLLALLIVALPLVFLVGRESDFSSLMETPITTEQTTLSAEQIEKARVKNISEEITDSLTQKGYSSVSMYDYCNFQDYIKGARNNPSDYLFEGTHMYSISQFYSNTKYFTNNDALEYLEEQGYLDADYIFQAFYGTTDVYGKSETGVSYILVEVDENGSWTYWKFDLSGDDELGLSSMIVIAAYDKCQEKSVL